jgi:peroxiredoxin/glycine cleavage system regulatory protein
LTETPARPPAPNENHLLINAYTTHPQSPLLAVTRRISDSGCNLVDARLSTVGRDVSVTALATGSWDAVAKLETMLGRLEREEGLKLVFYRTGPKQVQSNLLPYIVEVVAADKPGILFQLADFFDRQGHHHRIAALFALPRDADGRRHVLRAGDHRHSLGHAHRRAARRFPRVLRPPQPRRDHGSDEVLMGKPAKPLPRKLLDAPLAVAGSDGEREGRLSDHAGRWLVLYFYPKDSTPGCTTEGLDFSALLPRFRKLGADVLGVSRDSVRSHQNFCTKQGFAFDLVSDADESLCTAFDVIREKQLYGRKYIGIDRSTFLIDPASRVAREWRGVKVPGHAQAVLDALQQAQQEPQ